VVPRPSAFLVSCFLRRFALLNVTLGTQVHTYRCVYLCTLRYVGYVFGICTETYPRVPTVT
jgi:hypothetical protein